MKYIPFVTDSDKICEILLRILNLWNLKSVLKRISEVFRCFSDIFSRFQSFQIFLNIFQGFLDKFCTFQRFLVVFRSFTEIFFIFQRFSSLLFIHFQLISLPTVSPCVTANTFFQLQNFLISYSCFYHCCIPFTSLLSCLQLSFLLCQVLMIHASN